MSESGGSALRNIWDILGGSGGGSEVRLLSGGNLLSRPSAPFPADESPLGGTAGSAPDVRSAAAAIYSGLDRSSKVLPQTTCVVSSPSQQKTTRKRKKQSKNGCFQNYFIVGRPTMKEPGGAVETGARSSVRKKPRLGAGIRESLPPNSSSAVNLSREIFPTDGTISRATDAPLDLSTRPDSDALDQSGSGIRGQTPLDLSTSSRRSAWDLWGTPSPSPTRRAHGASWPQCQGEEFEATGAIQVTDRSQPIHVARPIPFQTKPRPLPGHVTTSANERKVSPVQPFRICSESARPEKEVAVVNQSNGSGLVSGRSNGNVLVTRHESWVGAAIDKSRKIGPQFGDSERVVSNYAKVVGANRGCRVLGSTPGTAISLPNSAGRSKGARCATASVGSLATFSIATTMLGDGCRAERIVPCAEVRPLPTAFAVEDELGGRSDDDIYFLSPFTETESLSLAPQATFCSSIHQSSTVFSSAIHGDFAKGPAATNGKRPDSVDSSFDAHCLGIKVEFDSPAARPIGTLEAAQERFGIKMRKAPEISKRLMFEASVSVLNGSDVSGLLHSTQSSVSPLPHTLESASAQCGTPLESSAFLLPPLLSTSPLQTPIHSSANRLMPNPSSHAPLLPSLDSSDSSLPPTLNSFAYSRPPVSSPTSSVPDLSDPLRVDPDDDDTGEGNSGGRDSPSMPCLSPLVGSKPGREGTDACGGSGTRNENIVSAAGARFQLRLLPVGSRTSTDKALGSPVVQGNSCGIDSMPISSSVVRDSRPSDQSNEKEVDWCILSGGLVSHRDSRASSKSSGFSVLDERLARAVDFDHCYVGRMSSGKFLRRRRHKTPSGVWEKWDEAESSDEGESKRVEVAKVTRMRDAPLQKTACDVSPPLRRVRQLVAFEICSDFARRVWQREQSSAITPLLLLAPPSALYAPPLTPGSPVPPPTFHPAACFDYERWADERTRRNFVETTKYYRSVAERLGLSSTDGDSVFKVTKKNLKGRRSEGNQIARGGVRRESLAAEVRKQQEKDESDFIHPSLQVGLKAHSHSIGRQPANERRALMAAITRSRKNMNVICQLDSEANRMSALNVNGSENTPKFTKLNSSMMDHSGDAKVKYEKIEVKSESTDSHRVSRALAKSRTTHAKNISSSANELDQQSPKESNERSETDSHSGSRSRSSMQMSRAYCMRVVSLRVADETEAQNAMVLESNDNQKRLVANDSAESSLTLQNNKRSKSDCDKIQRRAKSRLSSTLSLEPDAVESSGLNDALVLKEGSKDGLKESKQSLHKYESVNKSNVPPPQKVKRNAPHEKRSIVRMDGKPETASDTSQKKKLPNGSEKSEAKVHECRTEKRNVKKKDGASKHHKKTSEKSEIEFMVDDVNDASASKEGQKKTRRGLLRELENSEGFVGGKSPATPQGNRNLFVDSSLLSREERALQMQLMRITEMEISMELKNVRKPKRPPVACKTANALRKKALASRSNKKGVAVANHKNSGGILPKLQGSSKLRLRTATKNRNKNVDVSRGKVVNLTSEKHLRDDNSLDSSEAASRNEEALARVAAAQKRSPAGGKKCLSVAGRRGSGVYLPRGGVTSTPIHRRRHPDACRHDDTEKEEEKEAKKEKKKMTTGIGEGSVKRNGKEAITRGKKEKKEPSDRKLWPHRFGFRLRRGVGRGASQRWKSGKWERKKKKTKPLVRSKETGVAVGEACSFSSMPASRGIKSIPASSGLKSIQASNGVKSRLSKSLVARCHSIRVVRSSVSSQRNSATGRMIGDSVNIKRLSIGRKESGASVSFQDRSAIGWRGDDVVSLQPISVQTELVRPRGASAARPSPSMSTGSTEIALFGSVGSPGDRVARRFVISGAGSASVSVGSAGVSVGSAGVLVSSGGLPVGSTGAPVDRTVSRLIIPAEVRRLIYSHTTGETVLHKAARLGYEDIALWCCRTRYVDVDARDHAGYAPLHETCLGAHVGVARHLLRYGADVNAASTLDGTRPIHEAVEADSLPMVRLLLTAGADVTLATYSGRTALDIAHSPAMRDFLTAYLIDMDGVADRAAPVESVWDLAPMWDGEESDVLEGAPADDDDDDDDSASERCGVVFEFSDTPLPTTYSPSSCGLTHEPTHLPSDLDSRPNTLSELPHTVERISKTHDWFLYSSPSHSFPAVMTTTPDDRPHTLHSCQSESDIVCSVSQSQDSEACVINGESELNRNVSSKQNRSKAKVLTNKLLSECKMVGRKLVKNDKQSNNRNVASHIHSQNDEGISQPKLNDNDKASRMSGKKNNRFANVNNSDDRSMKLVKTHAKVPTRGLARKNRH